MRRLALKYDILALDQYRFERKPGVWDPLVGVGWHTVRDRFELHAIAEGRGFGVGSDVEVAGSLRADWKPFTHFASPAAINGSTSRSKTTCEIGG